MTSINLLSHISLNSKTIISIYAALVASIALIWNIYEAIIKNKGRLHVDASIKFQIIAHPLMETTTRPIINIKVTNRGQNSRYIQRPSIETNKLIDGKNGFVYVSTDDYTKFPYELNPGSQFETKIDLHNIFNDKLSRLSKNDYFHIEVADTHEKTYKSKRISMKDALSSIKVKI